MGDGRSSKTGNEGLTLWYWREKGPCAALSRIRYCAGFPLSA